MLNLLVKSGWVVLENLVQNQLGHAAFGFFAACSALTVVVATFTDLGLTQYTMQQLVSEPEFAPRHFPALLPLRGLLMAAALAVLLGAGWLLGYRGGQLTLLAVVGSSLLLTQYGLFLRGIVQARQRFGTDAVLSVFEKVLALALVGALLLGQQLGLGSYAWARLAAAAFTAVLFLGLLRRLFGSLPHDWPRWARLRPLLHGSLPFALIAVLSGVNERVDMVLLEKLSPAAEVGYYASAYRWLDAVMMYAWTVLPLFFVRFAHVARRPRHLQHLLWVGQRVAAVPLLLVAAFVLFRGEVLFWQFSHSTAPELLQMTRCLKVLFLNVLLQALFAIYGTLLTSTHHQKAVSWLVAVSIVLNIGLNLLTLPHYGAVAAAANTLLSVALMSGGYVWLVWQRTTVPIPWHLLARLLLAFGLLCGSWYLVRTQLSLSWWLESGLMALLFAALLLPTGLVRPRELRQLVGSGQKKRLST